MKPCLVIDAGGTAIKAGIVRDGQILKWTTVPAFSDKGLAPQLPRLRELLLDLCQQIGISVSETAGIGFCIPGIIDGHASRVVSAPKDKYADAEQVDLAAWAKQSMGLPIRLENDANAACLGEWKFGAGRGSDDLVMVTLGTGIGVSVVVQRACPAAANTARRACSAGILSSFPTAVPAAAEAEAASKPRPTPAHYLSWPTPIRISLKASSKVSLGLIIRPSLPPLPPATLWLCVCAIAALITGAAPCGEFDSRVRPRSPDHWRRHRQEAADVIIPHLRQFIDKNAWAPWGRVEVVPAAAGDQAGLLGMSVLLTKKLDLL